LSFLIDIFGYLTVVLHGLSITAEALLLGGVAYALLVAQPFDLTLGVAGERILRATYRGIRYSAIGVIVVESLFAGMQLSVLVDTADLSLQEALGAEFVRAAAIKMAAALCLITLTLRPLRVPPAALLVLGLVIALASVSTSHAAARLDNRALLAVLELMHRLGASVWIGGIPYFLYSLNSLGDGEAWRLVGRRFSLMSMVSVACIALAGLGMSWFYIGSWEALYGTAYGVMVSTKVILFAGLLMLGALNYRVVERLRTNPLTSILRLKRCAEVEIGVGITVLFCAASITSLPPANDLTTDRVTMHEIVERLTPQMPRLTSPDHAGLAIPALQAKLDAEASTNQNKALPAFVPGAGELPPRNASDIAWSEYNHHWAGILVFAIGLLALLEHFGLRAARHWPLLFLVLAAFLLVRSDPEVWPLGSEGLLASLRDPEVVQHRIFVLAIIIFGIFEWGVRVGKIRSAKAALVFPLITGIGAALLLTHSHAISNIKDQLLIELSHVPLAIFGVTAAWSRWLELRLESATSRRVAGFIWPVCFILISFILLAYREA
jgi:putative copper resistance protein D